MDFIKKNITGKWFLLVVLLIIFSCKSVKTKEMIISGTFLFELNAPLSFHSEADYIKQGNLIVFAKKQNLKNINLDKLYKNGIIELYDYSNESNNDTISRNNFIISLQKGLYDYENNKPNFKYITKDNLCYLPFKVDIDVTYLGYKKWLVPKILNYKCCSSDEEKLIKTYKINKVSNFKIIQDW